MISDFFSLDDESDIHSSFPHQVQTPAIYSIEFHDLKDGNLSYDASLKPLGMVGDGVIPGITFDIELF